MNTGQSSEANNYRLIIASLELARVSDPRIHESVTDYDYTPQIKILQELQF